MLTVRGVSKHYGPVAAVRDVDFVLEKGEIVGLLGVNGAGKTTTMNMISGYFPPSSGSISLSGYDVSEDGLAYRKQIGYLPEHPPLYLDMKIGEQLRFVCSAKGLDRSEWSGETDRVCELCSIEHVRNRVIRTMSKGYRQRVGLAQALIGGPGLLILDEPTSGLDPQQIIEIRELIETLRENHTVMISSHILSEIASVSTRVLIMHEGKIVADRPVGELMSSTEDSPVLTVRIPGDAAEVRKILSAIPGAGQVEDRDSPEPGCREYDIEVSGDGEIRTELTRVLAEHDLPVMAMSVKSKTLEDIFIELVTRN